MENKHKKLTDLSLLEDIVKDKFVECNLKKLNTKVDVYKIKEFLPASWFPPEG